MENTLFRRGGDATSSYIVVIGDATIDMMAIATRPVRPYASHQCSGVYQKRGGCARNTAENLARLGCDTRLISAFGDDPSGHDLMAATRLAGVDLAASRQIPGSASATVLIVNDPSGEHFCIIGDDSISQSLTAQWLQTQRPLLQDAALIVANTRLSDESLAWLFTEHHDQPIFIDTVAMDVVERIRPWLAQVHTIKLSRVEARHLSGLPFSSREHAPAIASWFHDQGLQQVILSLGEYGVYFSNGEHAGWMEAPTTTVVDVTGAGDALMAGLAYGWFNALPFIDTVQFALGCAAMTLSTRDNNHPELTRDAVMLL
jgi:pseudouridine kinase